MIFNWKFINNKSENKWVWIGIYYSTIKDQHNFEDVLPY